MEYFIVRDGSTKEGPFSIEDLTRMLAEGALKPAHLVWNEGMINWKPASAIPELAMLPGMTPPVSAGPIGGDAFVVNLASFGQRLGAHLIDGVILFAIYMGIMMAFVGVMGATGAFSQQQNQPPSGLQVALGCLMYPILFGAVMAYYAGMESSRHQATVGKMLLKLRVVDTEGNRISLGKASVRALVKVLVSGILLIGYIMAAFTERKQALHDMAAGTLVVQAR